MAPVTTKAPRSAIAEAPLNVRYINDSPIEDNCMLEPTPRKRACLEQHLGQQSEASLPTKRRKSSHPSTPPPAYWDNLSKIWLTQRALREFNRRNKQEIRSASRTPQNHLSRDLKSFSRHGGPDLSDLRSFPDPTHMTDRTVSSSRSGTRSRQRDSASASTRPTTNSTRTKSTGVYDRVLEQHLIDYNVYPDAYENPDGSIPAEPSNWDDLQHILARPRPSLSPSQFSDEKFKEFKKVDAHAPKEKQVSEKVIPIIEGTIPDGKCRCGGIPFNNLDPLTDGTLKPGNPDIYYGARPEQLCRSVRTELGGKIVPSTQHDLPMAPNFFLAVKGPDGSTAVARRQACYDSALGARGMASLKSYGQDEPAYGIAYTISTTYHDGQLKMYTNHLAQPSSPGGRPKYHMTQLNTWGMTGNADTFRQGARAYRNARDWAKEQRDDLIRQANERAASAEVGTSTNDDEASASPALSFVTAASDTEAYTMSQESRTTMNEGFNVLGIFEESDSSIETIADHRPAAQQSNKRKRRSTNAGSEAQLSIATS